MPAEKSAPTALEPRIETLPHTNFAGHKLEMSLSEDRTLELWQGFMPSKRHIPAISRPEFYSITVFPPGFMDKIDPQARFEKWAAVAVEKNDNLPDNIDIISASGLYAVFHYQGLASEAGIFIGTIFQHWLPNSAYRYDERPLLAVMGDKYDNKSAESEEEFWIPVSADS